MRKTFFTKTIAVVICLTIVGISASGLFAVEKKAPRTDARLLLSKPLAFFAQLFPVFGSLFKVNKRSTTDNSGSTAKVKPTGDTSIGRPSSGD